MSKFLLRSKVFPPKSMRLIDVIENGEDLVVVKNSGRLIVEPIWLNQIDPHEGRLYANYIQKHPGYQAIYVRKTVASMLSAAAKSLPLDYRLVVRAGHRPLSVQRMLLETLVKDYITAHSHAGRTRALSFARRFVSDPSTGSPPHCCGAAIDVDLFNIKSSKLVDFGCPVNTDSEVAYLHSPLISKQQHSNRLLLLETMLNAGFASNASEWWHYSFGDQRWAWFYGQKQAIYNLIEPQV